MALEGVPAGRLIEFGEYQPDAPRRAAPSGLRLRPAAPGDLDALAAIRAARMGTPAGENRAALARKLANERGCLLVALDGEHLLGFASAAWLDTGDPPGWYLTGVVVRPEDRRRGIATALTRARMEWVRERSPEVYYFASAQNRVSIDLHATFGFEEVTRDFEIPGTTFTGGVGILFRADTERT